MATESETESQCSSLDPHGWSSLVDQFLLECVSAQLHGAEDAPRAERLDWRAVQSDFMEVLMPGDEPTSAKVVDLEDDGVMSSFSERFSPVALRARFLYLLAMDGEPSPEDALREQLAGRDEAGVPWKAKRNLGESLAEDFGGNFGGNFGESGSRLDAKTTRERSSPGDARRAPKAFVSKLAPVQEHSVLTERNEVSHMLPEFFSSTAENSEYFFSAALQAQSEADARKSAMQAFLERTPSAASSEQNQTSKDGVPAPRASREAEQSVAQGAADTRTVQPVPPVRTASAAEDAGKDVAEGAGKDAAGGAGKNAAEGAGMTPSVGVEGSGTGSAAGSAAACAAAGTSAQGSIPAPLAGQGSRGRGRRRASPPRVWHPPQQSHKTPSSSQDAAKARAIHRAATLQFLAVPSAESLARILVAEELLGGGRALVASIKGWGELVVGTRSGQLAFAKQCAARAQWEFVEE